MKIPKQYCHMLLIKCKKKNSINKNRKQTFFVGKMQIVKNMAVSSPLPWYLQCLRTRHDDFKILPDNV